MRGRTLLWTVISVAVLVALAVLAYGLWRYIRISDPGVQ